MKYFTARWHDRKSKKSFPKKPENEKSFDKLKELLVFSLAMPHEVFYVNYDDPSITRYVVKCGKIDSTIRPKSIKEESNES